MVLYLFIRVFNDEDDVDIYIPGWFALEFAGAFIALLFWVYTCNIRLNTDFWIIRRDTVDSVI